MSLKDERHSRGHRKQFSELPDRLIVYIFSHFKYSLRTYDWAVFVFAGEERAQSQSDRRKILSHLTLLSRRCNRLATPLLYHSVVPIEARQRSAVNRPDLTDVLRSLLPARKFRFLHIRRLATIQADRFTDTVWTNIRQCRFLTHMDISFNVMTRTTMKQFAATMNILDQLEVVALHFRSLTSEAGFQDASRIINAAAQLPRLKSLQLNALCDISVYGRTLCNRVPRLETLAFTGDATVYNLDTLAALFSWLTYVPKLVLVRSGWLANVEGLRDLPVVELGLLNQNWAARPHALPSNLKKLLLGHSEAKLESIQLPEDLEELHLVNIRITEVCFVLESLVAARWRLPKLICLKVIGTFCGSLYSWEIDALIKSMRLAPSRISFLKDSGMRVVPDKLMEQLNRAVLQAHAEKLIADSIIEWI